MREVERGVDLDRREALRVALQVCAPLREVLGVLARD
jgi:hypothetical protein